LTAFLFNQSPKRVLNDIQDYSKIEMFKLKRFKT